MMQYKVFPTKQDAFDYYEKAGADSEATSTKKELARCGTCI
jgi:hypothetical protein